MNGLIESFKRLYKLGILDRNKLDQFLADKKITKEEYDYIIA